MLLVGVVVGSHITVSITLLGWLGVLWLMLLLSGQDERIESVSAVALGFVSGLLTWQLSGGEAWLPTGMFAGFIATIEGFRALIVDRIFLALPEPHGSLLSGILIGNRAKLDPELLETFRIVGLSHLIAVSGYNLSILTSNIQSLARPLVGQRSIFISLVVIILFVVLSGAPASILRAAVMASSLLLAQYLGRPSRSLNFLLFAAGILALFEPKIVFEIGFQLSIAATYGLIRFAPIIISGLERFHKIPETLRLIIGETVAATLITAPLLILYFDRLSLVSPISNLLVLPIMPLVMGLGIVAALLLLTLPAIGQLLVLLTWPLLEWIIRVSNKLAALPHAATTTQLPEWATILLLVIIVIAIEVGAWRHKQRADEPEMSLPSLRI